MSTGTLSSPGLDLVHSLHCGLVVVTAKHRILSLSLMNSPHKEAVKFSKISKPLLPIFSFEFCLIILHVSTYYYPMDSCYSCSCSYIYDPADVTDKSRPFRLVQALTSDI